MSKMTVVLVFMVLYKMVGEMRIFACYAAPVLILNLQKPPVKSQRHFSLLLGPTGKDWPFHKQSLRTCLCGGGTSCCSTTERSVPLACTWGASSTCISTNKPHSAFCSRDETRNSVAFIASTVPFCRNIDFLNLWQKGQVSFHHPLSPPPLLSLPAPTPLSLRWSPGCCLWGFIIVVLLA